MNMKVKKKIVGILVGAVTLSVASSAFAYAKIGQRLTQDPYHLYYWVGGVTTNLGGYNAQNNANLAMNAWNSTPNTKVYMYQTTDQKASVMDFHSEYHADVNELGWTAFYDGNSPCDPRVTKWSWAQMHINSNSAISWFNSSATYHDPNGKQQHVLAHEAGHGFGLDHIGTYSWTANRLMLQTSSSYDNYGTKGPTDDEVAGVQEIYGKLY
ncbi:matrixin family metalloprotease [Tumebacillus permanentifrigoris]|uniref:Matrixin n=1 Tax=Tumebacillus permanentifrigoris TaxID=378543 RepID=A0A316D4Z4_9BACL|nr:matrixin family metalloprotease [Tumebacillus permanentifrigoris]PWK07883.1 matrixin [Tumebacillus permanentifrigoris]